MTANLFLASWCVRIMRHRYETRLKDQKLTFRIVRVKHNTAHGTVEIDGIRYRAYIPPVWVKEHLDESGCFRELTKDIRRKRCKKRGSSVLFRFTATRTDRWSNSADILTKTEI